MELNNEKLNQKLYVLFTCSLGEVGGMQWYVKSKSEYLQRQGWNVIIVCGDYQNQKSVFPSIENLLCKIPEISILPIGLTTKKVQRILNLLIKNILNNNYYKEIVIESCNEITTLWGELLANELQAKHLAFILNERFRGKDKHYDLMFEYFKFKLERKELSGITSGSLAKLFDGYLNLTKDQDYYLLASPGSPVQDVSNEAIDQLLRADWNICSIGRLEKEYIPAMFEGVRDFALKYPNKKINFIIVGDTSRSQDLLNQTFSSVANINIVELGVLAPISRILYTKIDVVIATSGCASISAYEKVPTLSIDVRNFKVNGILGYTTLSTIYHSDNDQQKDYVEALEDVLIRQSWKELPFLLQDKTRFDESIYDKHFDFLKNSCQNKEYFDVMSLALPRVQCSQYRKKYYMVRLRNFFCQFPICSYLWNLLRRICGLSYKH